MSFGPASRGIGGEEPTRGTFAPRAARLLANVLASRNYNLPVGGKLARLKFHRDETRLSSAKEFSALSFGHPPTSVAVLLPLQEKQRSIAKFTSTLLQTVHRLFQPFNDSSVRASRLFNSRPPFRPLADRFMGPRNRVTVNRNGALRVAAMLVHHLLR